MGEQSSSSNHNNAHTPAEKNAIFDALRNKERYRLVLQLRDRTTLVEPDDPMYRHNHLPKLRDAGIIEWSVHDGEIRKGEKFDCAIKIVEIAEDYF